MTDPEDREPLRYAHGAVSPAPVITAAGGWCAPPSLMFGDVNLIAKEGWQFPTVTLDRGGITYPRLTPEELATQEAHYAVVRRIIDQQTIRRTGAIDTACVTALAEGYDVHVYDPPEPLGSLWHATHNDLIPLAYVGIAFTPREHPIPTLHHHPYRNDPDWDDD